MNGDAALEAFNFAEGEGEARWWLGSLATIKASAKDTGGLYTILEVIDPDGAEAPLHVHHREDEGFWIVDGEVTFEVGGKTISAGPGSFVFAPRGIPHRYRVEKGPAKLLFILTPGGFEDLVRATSVPAASLTLPPAPDGPPDEAEMEELATIARAHGAEILG